MKVALCFSGQMRTLAQCMSTIRRHLLEPLAAAGAEIDTFVHAAADADAESALLLSPRILHVEPQPWFDEKRYAWRIGRGCVGIQSVLRQLWSIKKSNDLKRQYAATQGIRYDWSFRVRPDTEFVQGPIEFAAVTSRRPPARGVFIPKFSNWYGLNDRFAWGSDLEMDTYSNRFEKLDDYIAAGGVFHPESFLFWSLAAGRAPILRSNVAFFTLRKNGDRVLPDFHSEYREATRCFPASQADCLDVTGLPDMPCFGEGKPSVSWTGCAPIDPARAMVKPGAVAAEAVGAMATPA
jgi:hypothetical protein